MIAKLHLIDFFLSLESFKSKLNVKTKESNRDKFRMPFEFHGPRDYLDGEGNEIHPPWNLDQVLWSTIVATNRAILLLYNEQQIEERKEQTLLRYEGKEHHKNENYFNKR